MKPDRVKVWLTFVACIFAFVFISFKFIPGGSVRGTVMPPEAGLRAFLFSGKDTVSANVVNGTFQMSKVPAGNFKLLIEAAPPYRNATKENIMVVEGDFTDAGQIELEK